MWHWKSCCRWRPARRGALRVWQLAPAVRGVPPNWTSCMRTASKGLSCRCWLSCTPGSFAAAGRRRAAARCSCGGLRRLCVECRRIRRHACRRHRKACPAGVGCRARTWLQRSRNACGSLHRLCVEYRRIRRHASRRHRKACPAGAGCRARLEVLLRLESGAPRRVARVAACGGRAWSAAEFGVTHADGIKRLVLLVLAAVHARAATVAPARLQCGSGTAVPLTACIGRLVPPTFCSQVTPLTRACPA